MSLELAQDLLVRVEFQLHQINVNTNRLNLDSVAWFPRKLTDLDTFADKVLEMGEELSKMHTLTYFLLTH